MELRTLKYFLVVAQELNITHAAEKLNISQPPLSAQIHGLEDELGTKLFIRGKRKLQLTEAGHVLYRRATQIMDLTQKVSQEISQLNHGVAGQVSIGLVGGRTPYIFARWAKGFTEEFPQVKFSLWNSSSDEVISRLSSGILDLAVIGAPYDQEHLDGFPVGREPWTALIPRSHPLAKDPSRFVSLASLKNEPLIIPSRKSRKEAIQGWFAEVGVEPNILCETADYLDAVAMSEQGIGISIFPKTTYTPNDLLVPKIIVDSERQIEYVLVWNKGQRFTSAVGEFVNYVKDFAEEERLTSPKLLRPEGEYVPSEDTPYL